MRQTLPAARHQSGGSHHRHAYLGQNMWRSILKIPDENDNCQRPKNWKMNTN